MADPAGQQLRERGICTFAGGPFPNEWVSAETHLAALVRIEELEAQLAEGTTADGS